MFLSFIKSRLELLLSIIFLFVPSSLISEQYETEISADQIIVNQNGMLQASGNVKVQYGSVNVKAEKLLFNQKNKFNQISPNKRIL